MQKKTITDYQNRIGFLKSYSIKGKDHDTIIKDLSLELNEPDDLVKAIDFMLRLNKDMTGYELDRALEFVTEEPLDKDMDFSNLYGNDF